MGQKNILAGTPPFMVEKTIKLFGENLKTARLRRGLSIKEVAEKIGTGVRAVSDAERGKPTTSIVVYMGLLWIYDLLSSTEELANPFNDEIGLSLEEIRKPQRSRTRKTIDNDF